MCRFDKRIQFQVIFPLAQCQQPHSAAIVDYALLHNHIILHYNIDYVCFYQ